MVCLLEQLFSVTWLLRQWQEGLIGDKEDPCNYRGI